MTTIIDFLNRGGQGAATLAGAILLQSSVLIAFMLLVECILGRKLRPALRYVLWLMVLLKLVLPPSLALPSGAAWWLRPRTPVQISPPAPVVVSYTAPAFVQTGPAHIQKAPDPHLTATGGAFASMLLVSIGLFLTAVCRWRQILQRTSPQHSDPAPEWLNQELARACADTGVRRSVKIRVVSARVSPALFGIVRPVILLPESLVSGSSRNRLRTILIHELVHLRRADVWVNCAQSLLQIIYWWHPLLWVANHRIRRVREEAVDEAVMMVLQSEGLNYAPALLEVARLQLQRPLASLGLVGILESSGALRDRVERLLSFQPPPKSDLRLTFVCALLFGATALPMGQAPAAVGKGTEDENVESVSARTARVGSEEAAKVVQEGKLLYEAGKLDEAEQRLRSAIQQDPSNQAAYYYLNLVAESRIQQSRLMKPRSGRERIHGELQKLRLDRMGFKEAPLEDVVQWLNAESKRLDPKKAGIKFLFNGKVDELGTVKVTIVPSMTYVPLIDALDAIVTRAEKPLKYSIEAYGVVFSLKNNTAPALFTRVIKPNPNTFIPATLRAITGKDTTVGALRDFLASIKVDLSPPKSIFWSEGEGTLLVRATLEDLDTIEKAILILDLAPAQVHLKAHFIALSGSAEKAFWEKHKNAELSPLGVRSVELESKEAQDLLKGWRMADPTALLSEASVTTISGRQCEIQILDAMRIAGDTNEIHAGSTLEVMPTIFREKRQIDLLMTARTKEFLGYDEPAQAGGPPSPRFRSHEFTVTSTVSDGRALVFGGMGEGQGTRPERIGEINKRLLVVVTPTLVDAAGNRQKVESNSVTPRMWFPTAPPRPTK